MTHNVCRISPNACPASTPQHPPAGGHVQQLEYLDDVHAELVVTLGRAAAEVVLGQSGHTRGRGGALAGGGGAFFFHRDR
jgi:hypothetical protein